MKEIVPVFISNNSVYEELDHRLENREILHVPVLDEAVLQKKEV